VRLVHVLAVKHWSDTVIGFLVDGIQFNFRAVAVIVEDGYVLLHRATFDDFWSLPGGRVEAGETSASALVRELREELGAEVGRMIWVVENFFRYEGEPFHGLGMYYEVTLGPGSPYHAKTASFDGVEDDLPLHGDEPVQLIFQWFHWMRCRMCRSIPRFCASGCATCPPRPNW
jgi:8-oxo-dGTP pyrophosphatase MutT (NUDIX family)